MKLSLPHWLLIPLLLLFGACEPFSPQTGPISTPYSSDTLSTEQHSESPPAQPFRLIAVGDNLIHEPIYNMAHNTAEQSGQGAYDFLPSYQALAERIAAADIAFLEQEVLVSGEEYLISAWPSFNSPQELARDMKALGFDIINLANNHILDKDIWCLEETLSVWQKLDMPWIGVYDSRSESDALRILQAGDCRIAFLGYGYGLNSWQFSDALPFVIGDLQDRQRMANDIAAAQSQADLVVISLHWGTEYQLEPDDQQRELALWLAEQNIDLILGHHPHVIQHLELLQRSDGRLMPVIYSLGNFISTQRRAESLLGLMLQVDIVQDETGNWGFQNPSTLPLVSHYERPYSLQPYVAVLPLPDYDETTAQRHDLLSEDSRISATWFQQLYESVIAESYRWVE